MKSISRYVSAAMATVLLAAVHTYAQQGMGVGVTTPREKLDVNGAIKIGTDINNTNAAPQGGAGTIRWNGTNFQGWDGTQWITFQGGNTGVLEDADTDTKVQVEESSDEDIIRFDLAGTEHFIMDGPRLEVKNSGGSVFMGNNAGQNDDLSTNFNVFIGLNAGRNTVDGDENVAIGARAMQLSTTTNRNTAIGTDALSSTVTGDGANVAVGNNAMRSTTTGGSNVAVGKDALRDNTTGEKNTSVGRNTHNRGVSGSNNTVVGESALFYNTSGNNNTVLGNGAFANNTNGSGNVVLGFQAGYNETGSNKLYIENSNSATPLIYGEFDNNLVGINGNLGIGTQTPTDELYVANTTGSASTVTVESGNSLYPSAIKVLPSTHASSRRATLQLDDWLILQDRTGTGLKDFTLYQQSTTAHRFTVSTSGNIGLGTQTPQSKLHVEGNIRMVDGNQLAGYIPVSDANGTMTWTDPTTITTGNDGDWTVSGNNQYSSPTGNVGIGSVSPAAKLDVNGKIQMQSGAAAGYIPVSDANGTMTWTDPSSINDGDWNTNGNHISNANTGNVGVGTTSPQDKLHVMDGEIRISNSTGAPSIYFVDDTDASKMSINYQRATDRLEIRDNTNSVQMVVTNATGNVGLGTVVPRERLHVEGFIRMVDGNQQAGYVPVSDANGTMTWTDPATISTSDDGDWTLNGNDQYSSPTGNVGIGSTNPAAKLDVNGKIQMQTGATVGYIPVSDANGTMTWTDPTTITTGNDGDWTVSGNDQYSTPTGNVGIGSASPAAKLDVNGKIQMQTGATAGYIPVSDANGTMTWTDPATISTASVDEIADADNDTKIQVEESNDEDIIRFDLGGTEYFTMQDGRLNVTNTGRSVFIGEDAGLGSGLNDRDLTYIGYQAGKGNTGHHNTAIGSQAMSTAAAGSEYNVAVGTLSMQSLTTGDFNIAMGHNALKGVTTGSSNVALGMGANQKLQTGNQNVAIGRAAMYEKTSGSTNVAVGYFAGENNVSGSGNVFLGTRAGGNETGDNKLYIENSNSASPLIYGEFDNDLVGINGNLGIGTQAPSDELHVEGSIRMVDGNQQVGYIPVSDANGIMTWTDPATITTSNDGDWVVNGSEIYNANTGNVGIGTTNPTDELYVANTTGSTSTATFESGNFVYPVALKVLPSTHASSRRAELKLDNWSVLQDRVGNGVKDFTIYQTSSGEHRLTISANGNVGLSEEIPQDKLHVNGSIRMVDGNQAAGYIPVSDANGTMTWTDPSNLDDGDWIANGNDQYSALSGNVGIGTSTPAAKLNVLEADESATLTNFTQNLGDAGLLVTTDYTNGAYTPGLFWNTSNNNPTLPKAGIFMQETNSGSKILFGTSNTYTTGITNTNLAIDQSGNLGVGTDSPTATLHVTGTGTSELDGIKISGPNGNAAIYTNGTGDLILRKLNQTDQLVLDAGGNIGVGTNAPAEELEVQGSIRMVDGNQAAGYIPVSDANGTMAWTDPSSIDDGDWTVSGSNIYSAGSGNVGIGQNSPSEKLHIGGNLLLDRAGVFNNTTRTITIGGSRQSSGNDYGQINFTNYDPNSGSYQYTGARISTENDGNVDDGSLSFHTADNGTLSEQMTITSDGNVGIGSTSPASKLVVQTSANGFEVFAARVINTANSNGNRDEGLLVRAGHDTYNSSQESSLIQFEKPNGSYMGRIRQSGSTAVEYVSASDERLKTEIVPTGYGLDNLLSIDVKDYYFKDDKAREGKQTGFIAQQLYQHYPVAVDVGSEDLSQPWGVAYGMMTPLLVKAIQDQQELINQLTEKITEMEEAISILQGE